MSAQVEALLSYRSVEVRFGAKVAVSGLSAEVHPGEILGVVGESGSGKTTVLRAAMKLLAHGGAVTAGEILFRGRDLAKTSEREMRKIRGAQIGMIFQDAGASFCPVRTVGSQVCESMRAHMKLSRAEAFERAREMFEKLNLSDCARIWKSYPFELSGGMNQRVCIAAAMLSRPQLLLADEPTSALDAAARRQVVQELRALRELFGTAIVLVSHDVGAVAAIADRVLVLKDGRTAECGEAAQVLASPRSEAARALIAAQPRLRRTE